MDFINIISIEFAKENGAESSSTDFLAQLVDKLTKKNLIL